MRTFVRVPRVSFRHLAAIGLIVGFAVLLVGCGSLGGDQNTFAPEGDVADKQRDIFFLALWPAIVILILVTGVLVFSLIRFRRKSEQDPLPKQVHGNPRLEIAWSIAPALLLLSLAVPMIAIIVDLGGDPEADALPVTVKAFQWSWQFEYPEIGDAEGKPLTVRGTPDELPELHIPVDRDILVSLESADVIHSFWVPKLAGKLDVIPGRTNRMKFTATVPGTSSGQCAEFCGLGHATMRFRVVAHTPAEFQAWVEEQLAAASASRN